MTGSIRARLTWSYVGLLVGCTAALLFGSWWVVRDRLGQATLLGGGDTDALLTQLAWQYGLAVAGVACLALGPGWLAAGHALAPVRAIAATRSAGC